MKTVNIAIVDADITECLKLQNLLQSRHYETVALHSLGELNDWLGSTPCRSVILDLDSLPIDRKFFRNLKRRHPQTTVLCMSRHPFHPELEEALRESIFACVNKPVDSEEIVFLLDSVPDDDAS